MPGKKTIVAIIVATGIAVTLPVIPSEMDWHKSYETIAFETSDGDLAENQYATDGSVFYVRTVPKNQGQFVSTTSEKAIVGKELVPIACKKCAYYDEFITRNGNIVRIRADKTSYQHLKQTKNALLPNANERLSVVDATQADAAISVDATTSPAEVTTVTSYSYDHTVSGDERVLVTGVTGADIGAFHCNASAITYNSVSMTEAIDLDGFSNLSTDLFYLASPDTGTNAVSITLTDECSQVRSSSISFNGANTSSPIDTTASTTNTTGSPSLDITTNNNNSYIVYAVVSSQSSLGTMSVPSPLIEMYINDLGSDAGVMSYRSTTDFGLYSLSITDTSNDENDINIAVAINEASVTSEETTTPSVIWFD